jgi:hypothetical protein
MKLITLMNNPIQLKFPIKELIWVVKKEQLVERSNEISKFIINWQNNRNEQIKEKLTKTGLIPEIQDIIREYYWKNKNKPKTWLKARRDCLTASQASDILFLKGRY